MVNYIDYSEYNNGTSGKYFHMFDAPWYKRLSFAHAQVLTTEMVLFELLTTSQNPKFKEVQALIK